MAGPANILVVSDLHFGEQLLPGATSERRDAIALGARTFGEFLRYHAVRRRDSRPWRLVIAGDLFDFMSVIVPASRERPARSADERSFGLARGLHTGVARMQTICSAHGELLRDLIGFAGAGHSIDIIVGNHDVELLEPDVQAELARQLRGAGADDRVSARIRIVPWFVYEPGVCWIEHGHVYDEGCSFEYNLSPCDPTDGKLLFNADYAAIRYLAMSCPELDPHGIEEWSLWGYIRYGWQLGVVPLGRLFAAYARFTIALLRMRGMHRPFKGRELRRRVHRERISQISTQTGVAIETLSAIDRLARAPLTSGFRRLGRMLMLDRFGIVAGLCLTLLLGALLLPLLWFVIGAAVIGTGAYALSAWLGQHMITSQLPMRAIPTRLRQLVDAPIVVFGHTHDPRWQPLPGGGLYVNSGTWLPATRPGLRRSFTHLSIQPRSGALPVVELRQWRDGVSQPFDAGADLGAGGVRDAVDWRNVS